MENKENKVEKWVCDGKHNVARWILGIAILVFVFSMGFSLGKFKMAVRQQWGSSDYGYGMYPSMMYRGGYSQPYGYGMGPWMMYGYGYPSQSQPITLPPSAR